MKTGGSMFKNQNPFSESFSQIFSQETVNLINVAASVLLLIIVLSFILIILERFYTFSKEICTFVGSDLLLNFSKDSLTPSLHFLMIYIFTF